MTKNRRLRFAIWTALAGGIFIAVLTIVLAQEANSFPIIDVSEDPVVSIAAINLFASFFIVLFSTAFLYRRLAPDHDRVSWIYSIPGRLGASILAAIFFLFASTFGVEVLDAVFPQAEVPFFFALVTLTLYGAAIGFVSAWIAVYYTSAQLLVLMGLTLVLGLTLATLNAQERRWWEQSLSFLGYNDGSNLLFDFTLILGGLLIIAVIGDVLRDLNEIRESGRITLRNYRISLVLMIAVGIGVILIGLFPTRANPVSHAVHQFSAWFVFGSFMFLMGGVGFLLPIYPKWFSNLGRGLLVLAILSVVAHYGVNIITFVTMEIVLILLVAIWCFIFAQLTDRLVTTEPQSLPPEFVRRLRYATIVGAISGIIGAIVTFLMMNQLDEIRIFSATEYSLAAVSLFLIFALTLIVTAISYRHFSQKRSRILARLVVALVVAILSTAIVLILSYVLEATFSEVAVTSLPATLMIGIISLLLGFGIAYYAPYFDGFQELVLLGVTFALGILVATTHAADPLWWQNSISFLGHDNGAFLFFSITLVLCGLLLIVIGMDLLASLSE